MRLDELNSFSELIEWARESSRYAQRKLSFGWLAQKLGYRSPQAISMVQKGQRAPSAKLVQRICAFLKLEKVESEYVSLLALKAKAQLRGEDLEPLEFQVQKMQRLLSFKYNQEQDSSLRLKMSSTELEKVKSRLRELIFELHEDFNSQGSPSPNPEKIYEINLEIRENSE